MADVIMPQMGESIAEGTVTKWLKNVGDKVERDEPLFEISTDKVDAEIPSPAAGILKEIRVAPGTTVPINTVVGVIAAEGEAKAEAPAPSPAPPATLNPPPLPSSASARVVRPGRRDHAATDPAIRSACARSGTARSSASSRAGACGSRGVGSTGPGGTDPDAAASAGSSAGRRVPHRGRALAGSCGRKDARRDDR